MTLAAKELYFLPYLGVWQEINAADIFLLADDYTFIQRWWINRNRICGTSAGVRWITLPLRHKRRNDLLNQMEICLSPAYICKTLRGIKQDYVKAPYYEQGVQVLKDVLYYPDTNLANFLEHSIRLVCDYLGITTPVRRTSEFNTYGLSMQYRAFEYCHQLGCDTFMESPNGMPLYDTEEFAQQGIKLQFIKPQLPEYERGGAEFVPGLSILDVIMYCSKEQIHDMLNQYTIVTKESK